MKIIKAKCGFDIIVDDSEFDRLNKHVWSMTDRGYAHRLEAHGTSVKTIRMHRDVMSCVTGDKKQVDHINGIKHDNRKENLRLCNGFQNILNVGMLKNNTSGLKGVHWSPRKKRWIARISVNGKRKYIGYYRDKMEAFFDYCVEAIKLHGEFANLGEKYAAA